MNRLLFPIAGICLLLSVSCSQLEGNSTSESAPVPESIQEAFYADYSNASDVVWSVDDSYAVATFTASFIKAGNGHKGSAWYSMKDFRRKMQKYSIAFGELPEAVLSSFQNSEYGDWTPKEKADVLTRYISGVVETIYVISAKYSDGTTSSEAHFYYTENGILVKMVSSTVFDDAYSDVDRNDEYTGFIPQEIPDAVAEYISSNYPGAEYLNTEIHHECIKVDILDGRNVRKLQFDLRGNWLLTTTKLTSEELPEVVLSAVVALYPDYTVKGGTEINSATDGLYYRVMLKLKNEKVEVIVLEDGTVVSAVDGDHDGNHDGDHDGNNVQNDAIAALIENMYPGAEITKIDRDEKGAEVEIVYNGVKIKVQFDRNGAWVKSERDFNCHSGYSNIPDVISAAIAELYPGYYIDYLVFIETAQNGSWYKAGLHSRDARNGMTVEFDLEGNVLNVYSH